jgi:uncharacterized membrane protein YagU involved in acid resistance
LIHDSVPHDAMSTETDSPTATDARYSTDYALGGAAGLAAGVVMGAMLTAQMRPTIAHAIPALYGLDGLAAGWGVHLVHSAVFGLVFAALAGRPAVREVTGTTGRSAAAGVAYGVVVWAVAAAVVMPVWLDAVGFANAPSVPNLSMQSLVGHVAYGLALGVLYPVLRRR